MQCQIGSGVAGATSCCQHAAAVHCAQQYVQQCTPMCGSGPWGLCNLSCTMSPLLLQFVVVIPSSSAEGLPEPTYHAPAAAMPFSCIFHEPHQPTCSLVRQPRCGSISVVLHAGSLCRQWVLPSRQDEGAVGILLIALQARVLCKAPSRQRLADGGHQRPATGGAVQWPVRMRPRSTHQCQYPTMPA